MKHLAQSLRALLLFNHHMLQRSIADLDDAALDTPIVPGSNTPRWILIHLAVGLDFALLSAGAPTLLDRRLLAQYGPGSSGQVAPDAPDKAAALAMIDAGVRAVDAALANMDDSALSRMARPHAAKLLEGTPLSTIGDTLAHLITTHFALHLGQLSMARRKAGHAPIL